jgi:glycosyltransferase involved in cell wall biosynthesis
VSSFFSHFFLNKFGGFSYERKKKIEIAIRAFKKLTEDFGKKKKSSIPMLLVIAGGYDARVEENVEYLKVRKDENFFDLVCVHIFLLRPCLVGVRRNLS